MLLPNTEPLGADLLSGKLSLTAPEVGVKTATHPTTMTKGSIQLVIFALLLFCGCKTGKVPDSILSGRTQLLQASQIPGIAALDTQWADIQSPVLYDTADHIGVFRISIKPSDKIREPSIIVMTDAEGVKQVMQEISFVNEQRNGVLDGAIQFKNGMFDAVSSTIEGVTEIVRHPIKFASELGDAIEGLAEYSMDVLLREGDLKNDVTQLVNAFFENACVETAEDYNLNYLDLQTSYAKEMIQERAYARVVGELLLSENTKTTWEVASLEWNGIGNRLTSDTTPDLYQVRGVPGARLALLIAKKLPELSRLRRGRSVRPAYALFPKLEHAYRRASYNSQRLIKSEEEIVTALARARRTVVTEAWRAEFAYVKKHKKGTRSWTAAEIKQLMSKGYVEGYDGHHIKSVYHFPEYAGDPRNIKFVTRAEHFEIHRGNWRTKTDGDLLDRGLRN